jgi:hypothetical protein
MEGEVLRQLQHSVVSFGENDEQIGGRNVLGERRMELEVVEEPMEKDPSTSKKETSEFEMIDITLKLYNNTPAAIARCMMNRARSQVTVALTLAKNRTYLTR